MGHHCCITPRFVNSIIRRSTGCGVTPLSCACRRGPSEDRFTWRVVSWLMKLHSFRLRQVNLSQSDCCAKAKSQRPQSEKPCDTVADSAGHGLITTGSGKAHPRYSTCLICGRTYVEKWWCSIWMTAIQEVFLLESEIKNPICRPTYCRLIL